MTHPLTEANKHEDLMRATGGFSRVSERFDVSTAMIRAAMGSILIRGNARAQFPNGH